MDNPDRPSAAPTERPGFNPAEEAKTLQTLKPEEAAKKLEGYSVAELIKIEEELELQTTQATAERQALQQAINQKILDKATPIPMPIHIPSADGPQAVPMPTHTPPPNITYH